MIFLKMFKVIVSTALALVISIPSIASAEQTKAVNKDIQVNFANNVTNNLSKEDISKITSQLSPTATSITIVESAPINTVNNGGISPLGNQCMEGAVFQNASQIGSYQFKKKGTDGDGTRYINKTGSNISFTSTFSTSFTMGGEINGEAKWGWGPIEAKAGFKISGSYTWSTSEASTVTVRPHYQGWNEYGTLNDTWTGYYAYLNTDCTTSNGVYITATGPRQKAVVANEIWANY